MSWKAIAKLLPLAAKASVLRALSRLVALNRSIKIDATAVTRIGGH